MSMKPGRELDVLIAKNVMGHEVFVEYTNYSADVSAAWEVVEKFDYNYLYRWDEAKSYAMPNWMKWECKLTGKGGSRTYMGYGMTAPHAICIAALLAVMEVDND